LSQLAGDTGPLVYPAGFLYVYAALRWLVGDDGRGPTAIRNAQWLFLALYLVVQALVLRIYAAAKPGPPWIAFLLAASKRVHSLFFLRMFNDCFAMAFAYAAVLLFTQQKVWRPTFLYECLLEFIFASMMDPCPPLAVPWFQILEASQLVISLAAVS
jgi:alpha-1,3-mannosyltransferase